MLLTVNSFIGGYHEHLDLWEPNADDEFLLMDSNAVAVVQLTELSRQSQSVHIRPMSNITSNPLLTRTT